MENSTWKLPDVCSPSLVGDGVLFVLERTKPSFRAALRVLDPRTDVWVVGQSWDLVDPFWQEFGGNSGGYVCFFEPREEEVLIAGTHRGKDEVHGTSLALLTRKCYVRIPQARREENRVAPRVIRSSPVGVDYAWAVCLANGTVYLLDRDLTLLRTLEGPDELRPRNDPYPSPHPPVIDFGIDARGRTLMASWGRMGSRILYRQRVSENVWEPCVIEDVDGTRLELNHPFYRIQIVNVECLLGRGTRWQWNAATQRHDPTPFRTNPEAFGAQSISYASEKWAALRDGVRLVSVQGDPPRSVDVNVGRFELKWRSFENPDVLWALDENVPGRTNHCVLRRVRFRDAEERETEIRKLLAFQLARDALTALPDDSSRHWFAAMASHLTNSVHAISTFPENGVGNGRLSKC